MRIIERVTHSTVTRRMCTIPGPRPFLAGAKGAGHETKFSLVVCEKMFVNFKRLPNIIKKSDLLQGEQCHLDNLDVRLDNVCVLSTDFWNQYSQILAISTSTSKLIHPEKIRLPTTVTA